MEGAVEMSGKFQPSLYRLQMLPKLALSFSFLFLPDHPVLHGNEVNASAKVGYNHSVILKTDGSLWTTGLNTNGRLGDGTTTNQSSPVQILSSGVKTLGEVDKTTLFIKSDHTLWGMGNNSAGQLGDGTTTDRHTPVSI